MRNYVLLKIDRFSKYMQYLQTQTEQFPFFRHKSVNK